jgi:hypothetical protein
MRLAYWGLISAVLALAAGAAAAQTLRLDRDGGFSFRFEKGDRRGSVEGKRANCEVYARIAQVQADANKRFRCGLRGPAWVADIEPHFRWCRYVPRRKVAEEQRNRSEELQRCFDKLGDFDDDGGDRGPRGRSRQVHRRELVGEKPRSPARVPLAEQAHVTYVVPAFISPEKRKVGPLAHEQKGRQPGKLPPRKEN